MKKFEIDQPKKQEILNHLYGLKDELRDEICFDCIVCNEENDFLEFIEEGYNTNKTFGELVEDFAARSVKTANLKASNVLTLTENEPNFSDYIEQALKTVCFKISYFSELEDVLSNIALNLYFKEQFNKNVSNIMSYLTTLTMIDYVENLTEEVLFENYVTVGEKEDILKYLKFSVRSYEYQRIEDFKKSYDYLVTLIPF